MKRKQKRKPVRNPKPIKGGGPVVNRRVQNAPLKPARSVTYQRTSEYAQASPGDDSQVSPGDDLQRGALDSLLDDAGPEDVSGFDA